MTETIKEVKEIKIRKIPRAGFFNIASFSRAVEVLGAELNDKGSHNTGLTESEERHYEKELDLKVGELKPHSKWWSEVFNVEHSIRLRADKSNTLILDSPINEIKYKVLLASSKVANSEVEKNKAGTVFYIDDIEAKAKKELETFNFEFEGMKLILKCTVEEKRGNLRLFGKKNTDLMSEDVLNAQLAQEMKKDPKNFFNIMTDKEIRTKAFIKELEERHLIKRTGNTYKYGEDIIGASTEECVAYFNDIKNQHIKLVLETKLKKAKKSVE
jgi:hypothetical protein